MKLEFPAGVARHTSTNNIAGLIVDQIVIEDPTGRINIKDGVTLTLRDGWDKDNAVSPQVFCQDGNAAEIAGGPTGRIATYSDGNRITSPSFATSADTSVVLRVTAPLTGTGGFSVNGNGAVLLGSPDSTFSGGVSVGATLIVTDSNALGTADTINMAGGATLGVRADLHEKSVNAQMSAVSASNATASLHVINSAPGSSGSIGPVTFTGSHNINLTLAAGGVGDITFAGVIDGGFLGVTVTGPGTTTFQAANTFNRATTVSGGVLACDGLVTSGVEVSSGGTLTGEGTCPSIAATTGGDGRSR